MTQLAAQGRNVWTQHKLCHVPEFRTMRERGPDAPECENDHRCFRWSVAGDHGRTTAQLSRKDQWLLDCHRRFLRPADPRDSAADAAVPVPVGVAMFAHDITQSVRLLTELLYDIRHRSEFECGGHFPAMEVPELLADDIRDFFVTGI